ncbi:GrpB family protein [Phocicoccus pinnipedialis]|uniref:Dephospho-CoA kinase/protein folding accessory domain-containing protein n=2 Tax=Phocicoccus pinnipedialis TaxID=110845 RepID=A0A6V7RAS3_9BACL|nr:hypothetical protein JEOPIN946_00796 [Jeotgalicoccus pinnipedialis]
MIKMNIMEQIEGIYLKATYPLLNTLRKVVVEVHHIGSSAFSDDFNTLDILFICKKNADIYDYQEILIADGYTPSKDKSPFFRNVLILSKEIDQILTQFIFISENDVRVKEILDLSNVMKKSKVLQDELKRLKLECASDYIDRKFKFYSDVKDIMLKGTVI